jgi:hypothetical protein
MLNDFQQLMIYLFSEHNERAIEYLSASQASKHKVVPPITKLDITKKIWQELLPERHLEVGGGHIDVLTGNLGTTKYQAPDMSDGERVLFYLVGQCLSAPPNGILVIDEPELHLHKSIQASLWDRIEAERSDCLFVYFTHDLDFAASRANATRIWLNRFDGTRWGWEFLPSGTAIPEPVLMTILGSRKSVLFVEGSVGSLDHQTFSQIYPNFTVVPCGGCAQVIEATKSFRSLHQLHHLDCYGIIDRDSRPDYDLQSLSEVGVHCLEVAEVENLFLTEEAIQAICEDRLLNAVEAIVHEAKSRVLSYLKEHRERITTAITGEEIAHNLRKFGRTAAKVGTLKDSYNTLIAGIDVDDLYKTVDQQIDEIVATDNYRAALTVINDKGLINQVAQAAQTNVSQYRDHAKRLLASPRGTALREAIRMYTPSL